MRRIGLRNHGRGWWVCWDGWVADWIKATFCRIWFEMTMTEPGSKGINSDRILLKPLGAESISNKKWPPPVYKGNDERFINVSLATGIRMQPLLYFRERRGCEYLSLRS